MTIDKEFLQRNPELLCWTFKKGEKTRKRWTEFLSKNEKYFKSLDGYIRIPKRRFNDIDDLIMSINAIEKKENKIKSIHKPFIFSLIVLLDSIGVGNEKPSTRKIKELLGYSKNTKSIDYLIKEDGILEKHNVISSKTKGVSNSQKGVKSIKYKRLKRKWKSSYYDYNKGKFIILNMSIFLYMLFYIEEIKVIGIYLYCYLLHKCFTGKYTKISLEKMKSETGLNEDTILKYLTILRDYNLVKIKRGNYILDEFGDRIGKEINEYKVVVELLEEELN